ncbi:MAG: cellulase family glycosylhydrolase, partial [Oceanococcus sp.]
QLAVMASYFVDDPYVLGYDLMNEPWAGSQYATCFKLEGCPQFDIFVLQSAMDMFARAVRSVDTDAIVFYEPQFTFDGGAKTWLSAPPEDVGSAAFSWHDLCISRALRQIFSSEELGDLLEQSCDAFHTQVYINAFEASVRMGVPAFMTEVLPANETDTQAMDCLLQRAEDNKISWTAGTIGRYPELNDENNVIALARVFPRAIAGEPLAYHFDMSTAVFTFTYTPDDSIEEPTLIGVPINVHYPNGYEVEVQNGRVISSPNVVHLLVEAAAGADVVGVVVRPAGDDSTVARPEFETCDKPTDAVFDAYSELAGALPVVAH